MRNPYNCLSCILCHHSLSSSKIYEFNGKIPYIGILHCKCSRYPVIRGILYLRSGNDKNRALEYIHKGKYFLAIITLSHSGRKIFKHKSVEIILSLLDNALYSLFFEYKIIYWLGLGNFLSLLGLIGFKRNARWYFLNRKRFPSYYFSLLASGLIENDCARVVDLGCGIGHYLRYLGKKIKRENIYGIDESFTNLLISRIFFAQEKSLLICTDLERGIPFKGNSLDYIHANDSFHCLRSKPLITKEIGRITKSSGRIAFIKNSTINDRVHNLFKISPRTLKNKFQKIGFKYYSVYDDRTILNVLKKNRSLSLLHSDREDILSKCKLFSIFCGKRKLLSSIRLSGNDFREFKGTKFLYS